MANTADESIASRPPYPPRSLGLGAQPSTVPDVPVCAVFLALFTLAAFAHFGLLQVNLRRRKRKFAFNAAVFGFCCTRILATSLRIAWAGYPANISLGLTAQIFVYAGIPILFFNNLFWALRIVRAQHPEFGWSKTVSLSLPILIAIAVLTILILISAVIAQAYQTDAHTQSWARGIQLYGATFFAITAILPIPIELLSTLIKTYPTIQDKPTDNFGSGTLLSKILISITSALFLSLGAWYRAITTYLTPLPVSAPVPWYLSAATFYIFNFTIEILVVFAWLIVRVDKVFIIPDGASGPYSYGNGFLFAGEPGNEKPIRYNDNLMATNDGSDTEVVVVRYDACRPSSAMTSATTLPPPTLSRAESWGSLQVYMSKDDFCPDANARKLADRRRSMPWEKHYRADSALCSKATISSPELLHPAMKTFGMTPVLRTGGFDPRSGRWDVRSLTVYSDCADLRPGSSLITAAEGVGKDKPVCVTCGRCASCGRSPRL